MKPFNHIVAIDGPAASGKTTAASLLAKRLGLLNINTGAMYRALSLKALRAGISPDDAAGIERLLRTSEIAFDRRPDGSTSVSLDGEDVTEEIKSQEVAEAASVISRSPLVRKHMVAQQRRIAGRRGAVAEGRDTTTVVFPDARHKFYVDASLNTRAERRCKELVAQGISLPLERVREDLRNRDLADQTRELSPLKKAPDAIVIDSTNLTPEQVVDRILDHLAPFGRGQAPGPTPLTPDP